LVAGVATGIVSGEPSAEPAAQNFLLAWAQGQYKEAAALTTGPPGPVATALRTAYQQLGAAAYYLSMGRVSQHSGVATAYFHASVDLGQDGAAWDYQGHFTLRKVAGSWKVMWSPAVIHPGLRQGERMAVVTRMPNRARILDAGGGSLIRPSAAWIAQVRPGQLSNPEATASAFAEATGLDQEQVLSVIRAAPQSAPLPLLTLEPSAFHKLRRKLDRVPGLTLRRVSRRLSSSVASAVTGSVGTEIAPALQEQGIAYRPGTTVGVSGLQQVYQRMLAGTAQTEVVAENAAGHVSVLKMWDGQRGTPVRTTIDGGVQTAADRALAGQPSAAAIIAVQASNGHVLAVANRNAAGAPKIDPLNGQYQPGNAFTIVSTAALLSGGQLSLDTPIPCRASTSVGGRTFSNVPAAPRLGAAPPFSSDFEQSCGTAFTTLSLGLTGSRLATSASNFGLGLDWRLPLSAFTGSFRAAATQAGLAANTVGQQGVEVSPLDMALVAAGVDAGTWRPPVLVTSPPDPGLSPRAVAGAQTVGALRQLMRAVVTNGAARSANLRGAPVSGQVGTAQVTPGSKWWAHWFVGYRSGVAFAVLQLTKGSGGSAVPLGRSFLSGLGG
jgi:cell division protein FtsI/penicillin-binding protein 2